MAFASTSASSGSASSVRVLVEQQLAKTQPRLVRLRGESQGLAERLLRVRARACRVRVVVLQGLLHGEAGRHAAEHQLDLGVERRLETGLLGEGTRRLGVAQGERGGGQGHVEVPTVDRLAELEPRIDRSILEGEPPHRRPVPPLGHGAARPLPELDGGVEMDLRRRKTMVLKEQEPGLGVQENGRLDGVEVDLVG